ncbi:MAG TPA: hypothetical protein VMT30_06885 [Candidatus Saccharimonadia bacterium]|nr:hypothetical protein [Candidatus Saccharimonadia bacterium]
MNTLQPPKTTRQVRTKYTPLSYERLAILLAVAAGPIDCARIAEQVLADTVANIVLKKSTAYYLISELTTTGHLQKHGSYTLTAKGRQTLQRELARLEQQRRLLLQRLPQ